MVRAFTQTDLGGPGAPPPPLPRTPTELEVRQILESWRPQKLRRLAYATLFASRESGLIILRTYYGEGSDELMEEVIYRRWFLNWAIQKLSEMFPSKERMRRIKCVGHFKDVTESSWVSLFQAYLGLEQLKIEDWGLNEASSLLYALRWLNNGGDETVRVLCSKLKSVSISGVPYTPSFMSTARSTFAMRASPLLMQTPLALRLHMLACDHTYSADAQDDDVQDLRQHGVEASIQVEDVREYLILAALQWGVSVKCDEDP